MGWVVHSDVVLDSCDAVLSTALEKKKILEEECAQQTNLLKEKDAEIANLKFQFSLKEAEAAEAIRLRSHVATVEATEALHAAELNLLKEINSNLEAKMRASEEKAAAMEFEKSGLIDQVSSLEISYAELRNQVTAGIEHGKAGRALSDVAAYNPSAEADYVAAVSALRDVDFSLLTLLVSQKDASVADIMDSLRLEGPATETLEAGELQPSYEQLMLSIHRPKDNVVLGETSLSFSLEVKDPSSGGIVFEKEELETSPEPATDR
ncbi:hypothetical protein Tco_1003746 [Tanacetum coccineum]|uniref:Uncharacterized protein n=1 Tax=Tanacetum coccineum TaxID=301880 RepID=A0ABQ5FBE8_9ASTR